MSHYQIFGHCHYSITRMHWHSGNTWVISQVSVNITLKNNYRVMIHVLLLIRTPINLINAGIIAMATSAETIRIWLTAKVVNTLI